MKKISGLFVPWKREFAEKQTAKGDRTLCTSEFVTKSELSKILKNFRKKENDKNKKFCRSIKTNIAENAASTMIND